MCGCHSPTPERRLLLFAVEKSARPVDCFHVAVLAFRFWQHTPIEFALEVLQTIKRVPFGSRDLLDPRIPFRPAVPRIVENLELKLVPVRRRVETGDVMKDLAHSRDMIAVVLEIGRQAKRHRAGSDASIARCCRCPCETVDVR